MCTPLKYLCCHARHPYLIPTYSAEHCTFMLHLPMASVQLGYRFYPYCRSGGTAFIQICATTWKIKNQTDICGILCNYSSCRDNAPPKTIVPFIKWRKHPSSSSPLFRRYWCPQGICFQGEQKPPSRFSFSQHLGWKLLKMSFVQTTSLVFQRARD